MITKSTVQDLKLFINNLKHFEKGFHALLIDYLAVTEENKRLKETLEQALTGIEERDRMIEERDQQLEEIKTVH